MKILVTFTFDVSLKKWQEQGILERETTLYRRISEKGFKVGFLTYGDNEDLKLAGSIGDIELYPIYSYIRRPASKFLRLFLSFWVPIRLKDIFRDYDIYKTNQMLGAWVALIGKLLYKKRLVARCGYEWMMNSFREGSMLKKIFVLLIGYPMEFLIYAASDRITVPSRRIADFVRRVFGQPRGKIICIPNFVDTALFTRKDAQKSYNDRVLYIGRLHKTKNLLNLLEALRPLRGIGLDIIGDGSQLQQLKEFAESNGLDVRFFGIIPNSYLPDYINGYPVFALVSSFENSPKALLEAMACERVVIGSDVEGIKDLINDNLSGILVGKDAPSIREGLKKAFRLRQEDKTLLGRYAREFVEKTFSLERVLNAEIGLYHGAA